MSVIFSYAEKMRASRLLSILILLQLRGRLTAEALAREFEVSVRTIYRDIDALSAAGIPLYGDSGPNGGYQLLDGYRTRLTGLGSDEAEALMLIGLPQVAASLGLGTAASRARDKLLAALPGDAGDEAERIAARFHLDALDWYRSTRPVPFLPEVARAVLDRRAVRMTYQSWRARREWQVDPWGVVLKAGNWYLVGLGAGKTRSFNVADIHALEVSEATVTVPANFDLATWWDTYIARFEERLRPGRARLRASPRGIERLRLLGPFAGIAIAAARAPDPEGWIELVLPIETIASAAPMMLGIGPEIDILDPPELREAVRELASEVQRRIDATD